MVLTSLFLKFSSLLNPAIFQIILHGKILNKDFDKNKLYDR